MRVVVIGAGYMGSALAVVARGRGHAVSLVGTWHDDAFIDAARAGAPHPRLKLVLPEMTHVRFEGATLALGAAELVVLATTSDGVVPVLERIGAAIPALATVGCVSKGFVESRGGKMVRLSQAVDERFPEVAKRWVAFGGPAKAMEVARGVPTAFVFGASDRARAEAAAAAFGGGHVAVETTGDLPGVEAAMALKNAYATAGGLWDGLCARGLVDGGAAHNAKAMLFALAIREMAAVAAALGGRAETIFGMAGVGDLHVTQAAGRNRAYGEAVGRGGEPAAVAREMAARGELTEGYPAIHAAWRLVNEIGTSTSVPMLAALYAIVYESAAVDSTLRNALPLYALAASR